MNDELPIPFQIILYRRFGSPADLELFRVEFAVFGETVPAQASIRIDDAGNPSVVRRSPGRCISLAIADFDLLAIACWKLCMNDMVEYGGNSVLRTISDASKWLLRVLPEPVSSFLLPHLRSFVPAGLTCQDVRRISDDDNP